MRSGGEVWIGHIRRLIRSVTGRIHRPGDRLSVSVTARGYHPIRARITIRVKLL
jgi:hypothetical protein